MSSQLCEICGGDDFCIIYTGPIRDGVYGAVRENAEILECTACRVHRLSEKDCIPADFYESGEYRKLLEQSLSGDKAVLEQDEMQHFTLEVLWPTSLRGKAMVDVGCGVGSLLDMTRNVCGYQIGIEPCVPYQDFLREKGYHVYSSLESIKLPEDRLMDWAFSIQVVEHVGNPREFLTGIRRLLKPGGRALISTPNRNDILRNILADDFNPFFYRTAHRWYFDESSLEKCAKLAGFKGVKTHFVHRYGMANALYWLRDKKPKGRQSMPQIDVMADQFWKGYLESNKQSDTIYIELEA